MRQPAGQVSRWRSSDEAGQILLMTGLMLTLMIAVVALVVDGGYAWGQFRHTQNGADAAARAGAAQLMLKLNGSGTVTDANVDTAVHQAGTKNGVTITHAYYTDISGALLRPDGATTTDETAASKVGDGAIPPCNANCAGPYAAGVIAEGTRDFSTFFAQIMGFTQLHSGANATAVTGWIQNPCEDLVGCPLLPLSFPVNVVACNQQNRPVSDLDPITGQPHPYVKYFHYTIPLCRSDPGNVGWLDWNPPDGGVMELRDAILHPQSRNIIMPEWYGITQPGNTNAVEDAINTYAGQVVFIPMFDSTCNMDPPGSAVNACPPANVGGNGQNQYYHLPQFGAFLLDDPKGAFIQGNNQVACAAASGSTSCLRGMFVDFQIGGTVGTAPPDNPNAPKFSGVQLID